MRLVVVLGLVLIGSCGGPGGPPTRGVLERDVGGYGFRRYQKLLDVEVWVAGNAAVAHSASYARAEAEARGRIGGRDVVSAVVTRYRTDVGVARALVKFARRLAQDGAYRVEETKVRGVRVFLVVGGGEAWAMWAARGHVIKIGGPGLTEVPAAVIEAYGERYRSTLEADALEGPLPPGPDEPAPTPDEVKLEPDDPADPEPDWRTGTGGQ